jgi:hypothetical protein
MLIIITLSLSLSVSSVAWHDAGESDEDYEGCKCRHVDPSAVTHSQPPGGGDVGFVWRPVPAEASDGVLNSQLRA